MFELKKIGIIKRLSALLLDAVLLAVLTTGFMCLIGLICKFDKQQDKLTEYGEKWNDYCLTYYGEIADYYGYTFEVGEDKSFTLKKDGKEELSTSLLSAMLEDKGKKLEGTDAYNAYTVYQETPYAHKYDSQFSYVVSLIFMMISIGLLLSYIALEFVIPLFFKNGQTIGKKVFGIGLVKENCVKIKPIALFARTLLGKFAIETMFPVALLYMFLFSGGGILMLILIAALALLDIIMFFVTKNKTPIHDMLAATVAIDMKTQMIYASEDELIAKKTLQDREEATAPEQQKMQKVENKNFIIQ